MSKLFYSMLCGVCIAMCTVLNAAFASLGTYCQFYIPIFICLLICPAPYVIVCAAASPLIAVFFSAQTTAALLAGQLADCVVFALSSLALLRCLYGGRMSSGLIITLICAVVLGRTSSGVINAAIFTESVNSAALWTAGAALKALPDVFILTLLAPVLKTVLEKNRLIHIKYTSKT